MMVHKFEALADISRVCTIFYLWTERSTSHIPQWLELKIMFLRGPTPERQLGKNPEHTFVRGSLGNSSMHWTRGEDPIRCPRPGRVHITDIYTNTATYWISEEAPFIGTRPEPNRVPESLNINIKNICTDPAMYRNTDVASGWPIFQEPARSAAFSIPSPQTK